MKITKKQIYVLSVLVVGVCFVLVYFGFSQKKSFKELCREPDFDGRIVSEDGSVLYIECGLLFSKE